MQEATKRQFRQLAMVAAFGVVAGVAYMPFISNDPNVAEAARFAGQGLLITLFAFGFEIFVAEGAAGERLRRAPFAVVFVTKALTTTLLIVAALIVGGFLFFPGRFAGDGALMNLARDTGYALAASSVAQFVLLAQTIVGGRVLANIIIGRYHKPLSEQRIFMFLDVADSTSLAEKAGDVGAYATISRFFFDVAQETVRYGGETHEYVGDAVIVTWPLDTARKNARCLECYFAICERMQRKAQSYAREFDFVPRFRVGLHAGPIVAGECGEDKRQIVYFGDTINTAARVQEACKTFSRPLLVSGDLLRQLELESRYPAISLGPAKLRGREQEIELFTVERQFA
jgi:adenylate cyclase